MKTLKPRIQTLDTSMGCKPVERDRSRQARNDRERILLRDNYTCQLCLFKGIEVKADEVDHIMPLADGGADTDSNKQSLCIECHKAKTKAEIASRS